MTIYQTVYVSSAAQNTTPETIKGIVAAANSFNNANQITGVLLFRGGMFLQLLEGEKTVVEKLFQKIKGDPRHANVIQLFGVEGNTRAYSSWAMAYSEVSDLDVSLLSEVMSWNKIVAAVPGIDNKVVMLFLERFRKKFLK